MLCPKKFGFTLAEVLITLAIIGIVAAMTIPSLVQKYKERAIVTRVKKTAAMLNEAYKLATLEYGDYDNWNLSVTDAETGDQLENDYSGPEKVTDIMCKYLKHTKRCKRYEKCTDGEYNVYKTNNTLSPTVLPDPACKLVDGTIFFSGWVQEDYTQIGIILPHKPNKIVLGKDMFYFALSNDGVKGMAAKDGDPDKSFEKFCKPDSDNAGWCTAWIIQHGNMDYLRCDDLSWDGKHKCN